MATSDRAEAIEEQAAELTAEHELAKAQVEGDTVLRGRATGRARPLQDRSGGVECLAG